jgi:hypothetical protein
MYKCILVLAVLIALVEVNNSGIVEENNISSGILDVPY